METHLIIIKRKNLRLMSTNLPGPGGLSNPGLIIGGPRGSGGGGPRIPGCPRGGCNV